ncbi:MAG: SDR family oxidoreductase [Candidatus Doudnabacteria bacterium]|nr:SDR family oxidoreductase [Candidatus Doudnabacteria bacterium]
MELKNKVIVITGSSKGLGKGLAKAFIQHGSIVVLNGRNKTELDSAAKELNCFALVGDVSKEQELESLKDKVLEKYGKIDVWINNAGFWIPRSTVEDTDWAGVAHKLFEVNFFGTVFGSKVALTQMRRQGSGVIINILSTGALDGREKSSAYRSSKFAAAGFTKCLRRELAGSGISALSIYPGGMKTNLFDAEIPEDFDKYMEVDFVADKILNNLLSDKSEEELIIARPNR